VKILLRRWSATCLQVYLAIACIMLMNYLRLAFVDMDWPNWSLALKENRYSLVLVCGIAAQVSVFVQLGKSNTRYYKKVEG